MTVKSFFALLIVVVFQPFSFKAVCQETKKHDTTKVVPDGTEGLLYNVDSATGKLQSPKANDFDGAITTFRVGLGFIYDATTYIQSDVFKEQVDSAKLDVSPKGKLRDFRMLASGVFKTKRSLAWKFAYMWDGENNTWLVRETGLTIGVPELAGHFFIGRTKEGFSLVKVMNGHSPWTNERLMAIDVIPILADGIKWFGYLPKSKIFWNLGYFNDVISKGQGFSTFEWQTVARVGFMPVYNVAKNKVLHLGANFRYGKPLDGKITLKSRPESNPTPQLINTGSFQADNSSHIGTEIYYRKDRLMLGSEMYLHSFYSDKADDHQFHGGDIVLSYFFTKTSRPYNTIGSIFGFIPVRRSVTKGGWGEFEGVLSFSTLNLNDGSIQGGKFWRITPMVNWYLTKHLRWEFIYGYGQLERFNKKGNVQFFETRFQITLM
jgi:phosphate-selective porin OprO and OprP